ncbi:gliding motility-associated C-terminal domain-containing protein [Chryseolinea sp. H1M3-3]|uniref:T9SS type B sorting domain-containing protein n=1 Tax=Chryseolinea sp. H1M3-3 TaxID=3034144 RepID=UPI0023EAEEEC|nr:gliding motility-associated C-terminal domain-containing protein [Chryseolinea sp. H1M3-3]
MSRLIIVMGIFMLIHASVVAQTAEPNLGLPDSIKQVDTEWVDLDNDGLLEVLLFMKTATARSYAGIIKGDSVSPLSELNKVFPILNHGAHLLADYNRDNAIDLIISGEKNGVASTFVYLNRGAYNFEKINSSLPAFSKAAFMDLDNNARAELIISGEDNNGYFTKILKRISGDTWVPVHDSLKIHCSAIETVDANGDGQMDLFLSGKVNPDSLFTGLFINRGNFYFNIKNQTALAGQASRGDFDGDGFFEILLMAENKNGEAVTVMYQKNGDAYRLKDLPVRLKNGRSFIADLNYDGMVDINYSGIRGNDTVNILEYSNGQVIPLPDAQLISHRFGDMKHDGNLDLLTVKDDAAVALELPNVLMKSKNFGPGAPLNAVALPVFNRVFMYWDKPADDHTPQKSLTYDVFLDGAENYQSGEFDLMKDKRLTVTHGNNGTQNFKLLRKVSVDGLRFSIQSVDNSFHAGSVCLGGTGVGGSPCATIATEAISACSKEKLVFTSPPTALWFSFSNGFVGIGSEFSFADTKGDTIFYYNPMGEACSLLKAWAIQIKDDTLKVEKNEKYVCADASVSFEVEPGWGNVFWTSLEHGDLGSSNTITIKATKPDSITVKLSNTLGCTIIRKTAVKLSKSEVKVAVDHFRIMKGSNVQLQASGAQRYIWAPPTGLSQPDVPNPTASPSATTQYTVTGYDSLNCASQAQVTIMVEETGFIPNLFSPNNDGQNDQLKIYGLVSAQQFSISIYDREGSLVYKTSNLPEALQHGWDGTKNGLKQPPGVYFWKVKGALASGPLLLNGKDSGSVVLIR